METIIQGDNKPIVLEFDESIAGMEQFSAMLYSDSQTYRHWEISDITIDGNTLSLPLTQKETLAIQSRYVSLEVKFLADGNIEFFDVIRLCVKDRRDRTVFELGGARP